MWGIYIFLGNHSLYLGIQLWVAICKVLFSFFCLCSDLSYSFLLFSLILLPHTCPPCLLCWEETIPVLAGLWSQSLAGHVLLSPLRWSDSSPTQFRWVSRFGVGPWEQGHENCAWVGEWAGNNAAGGHRGTSHHPFGLCLISFEFINSLIWMIQTYIEVEGTV